MMKIQRTCVAVRSMIRGTLLASIILMFSPGTYAKDNVVMRGALVTEPCVIAPGDESIQLDFGTIVDKYLYLNQRTHGQEFKLRLSDCDLSLGNTVRISFSGAESQELPGLLEVKSGGESTGFAIGLETTDGEALPINDSDGSYTLKKGVNLITINAYLQAEPKAISDRRIKYGGFKVVANFRLDYQ